jgi:UDP-N-acetylglucosamine 4-epimerase
LSPYAVTKVANELFATVFQRTYDIEVVGLRYFNVFGPRQDPEGPYAAVIPRWVAALLAGVPCRIYGDGETSRDFSYVANAVQANLLAATAPASATGQMYNIACGESTSLNTLFRLIRDGLGRSGNRLEVTEPIYDEFRPGDIPRSLADITRAQRYLGYRPTYGVAEGLEKTLDWYTHPRNVSRRA